MDSQRKMHAHLTIGATSTDLGTKDNPIPIETLIKRFMMELRIAPTRAKQIIFHLSVDPVNESSQSLQAKLQSEFDSSVMSHEQSTAEEWQPGISYAEMAEAVASEEYRVLCKAIADSAQPIILANLRANWRNAYPRVAEHLPPSIHT